jgi:glyoxylase-like metal-dependent hydrolase (beta-lactamase superfamily II)
MNKKVWMVAGAFAIFVAAAFVISTPSPAAPAPTVLPDLEYLKTINEAGPPADPQLIFLLSAQYANAKRLAAGIASFEGLLRDFGARLQPAQKALYLTALASLRAQHANDVPLLRRIGWVRDTLAMLDEAKSLTRGQAYITRWMSGVVRSQLPALLRERETALQDLLWCEQNAAVFPHPGWLREVYFQLGALRRSAGDVQEANHYLALSGYAAWDKHVTFTTPFSVDARNGHTFAARAIREVVPGRVFALSGFEFTEHHFVVTADGKELVAIDAGTRADTAKAAYDALKQRYPGLPPLSTVFITHAHWDHVGGHRFFRSIAPAVKFYGRENHAMEQARESGAGRRFATRFFGAAYDNAAVLAYKPDVAIDRVTELKVGGTRFELVPASGGETEDALMVFMPAEGVLFAGDVVMPYIGSPFVNEGNLDGLFQAIAEIERRQPKVLLHGHEPLTRVFDSSAMLAELRTHLTWLRAQVLEAIQRGEPRAATQQRSLIPPGIARSSSRTQLAYLVLRENTINRIYHQHTGYWQADLQGMDGITHADQGALLVDYLGLDERRLAKAAERLVADGRHEQAAMLVQWVAARGPIGRDLEAAGRLAFARLMERYQEYNPFKFIVYSGEAGIDLPRVHPTPQPPAAR